MKEKIKQRFDELTIKQLVMIFTIVLLIDIIHEKYLTATYDDFQATEIFDIVSFYWLSLLIGIVELIIGILIFYKDSKNYEPTFQYIVFFQIPFTQREFEINLHWLEHKVNTCSACVIVTASVLKVVSCLFLFF